ncbi:MAG: Ig-like domain-containing protein, partial [Deltaproteobacteria bacterium]|nr:Ig-like domain-containing protein [Deltaproteobacteria bacterium]
ADTSNVALNTTVTATFSETMDPSSINMNTFVLKDETRSIVSGSVTYDQAARTAVFAPDAMLKGNSEYQAAVYTDVRDAHGNFLPQPRLWIFTTAPAEAENPAVDAVHPIDGSNWVMPDTKVMARFSEAMNSQTIDHNSFQVIDTDGVPINGTVSYSAEARSAYFTPAFDFTPGNIYTAIISVTITDLAGNRLEGAVTWNFTIVYAITDSDGDGVVDVLDDHPNDSTIASPPTATGKGNLTISGAELSNVRTMPDFDPSLNQARKPDANEFDFPFGLVRFNAAVATIGGSATVTITFPEAVENMTRYYKVTEAGFVEFDGAVFDGNSVILTMVDGGAGDQDGLANGIIVDPGGMAVSKSGGRDPDEDSGGDDTGGGGTVIPPGPGPAPNATPPSSGGGGGCFISSIS